jgi:hypothetical protein
MSATLTVRLAINSILFGAKQVEEKLASIEILNGLVPGHDRGTLWVECRKCHKIIVGFSPCHISSRQ